MFSEIGICSCITICFRRRYYNLFKPSIDIILIIVKRYEYDCKATNFDNYEKVSQINIIIV